MACKRETAGSLIAEGADGLLTQNYWQSYCVWDEGHLKRESLDRMRRISLKSF